MKFDADAPAVREPIDKGCRLCCQESRRKLIFLFNLAFWWVIFSLWKRESYYVSSVPNARKNINQAKNFLVSILSRLPLVINLLFYLAFMWVVVNMGN